MSDYYAPNQQVVRADGSGPAEEGSGGSAGPAEDGLDGLTRNELVEEAEARGVEHKPYWNKDELKAALRG